MGDLSEALIRLREVGGWVPRGIIDVGAHRAGWAKEARAVFPSADFLLLEGDPDLEPDLKAFGEPYAISIVGARNGKVTCALPSPHPARQLPTARRRKSPHSCLPVTSPPSRTRPAPRTHAQRRAPRPAASPGTRPSGPLASRLAPRDRASPVPRLPFRPSPRGGRRAPAREAQDGQLHLPREHPQLPRGRRRRRPAGRARHPHPRRPLRLRRRQRDVRPPQVRRPGRGARRHPRRAEDPRGRRGGHPRGTRRRRRRRASGRAPSSRVGRHTPPTRPPLQVSIVNYNDGAPRASRVISSMYLRGFDLLVRPNPLPLAISPSPLSGGGPLRPLPLSSARRKQSENRRRLPTFTTPPQDLVELHYWDMPGNAQVLGQMDLLFARRDSMLFDQYGRSMNLLAGRRRRGVLGHSEGAEGGEKRGGLLSGAESGGGGGGEGVGAGGSSSHRRGLGRTRRHGSLPSQGRAAAAIGGGGGGGSAAKTTMAGITTSRAVQNTSY